MLKFLLKLNLICLFILCFGNVNAQLSGSYTINPNGSGTKNYQSFTAAISALNSSGISGPVTFNVSNATYTESIVLNYVSGSSTTNTITFKGADSSKAILKYQCTQYESVVKVNAASHFNFSNLTIESTDRYYGFAVHITSGADNISIQNCIVKTSSNSPTANCIPIMVAGANYNSYGANGKNIAIDNCIVEGGYFGVMFKGTSTNLLSKNFSIKNTTISKQSIYGIWAEYIEDLLIDNIIVEDLSYVGSFAAYLKDNSSSIIQNSKFYPGRYGLYITRENYYNRTDSSRIINNEISDFSDVSYQSGIFSNASFKLRIYHNTVKVAGTVNTNTYSALYLSAPNNHQVLNNSLYCQGSNTVLYLGLGTFGTTKIDYNNYYSTNGSLASWQGSTINSLSALKSASTSHNTHSYSEDPVYTGNRNLVPKGTILNNRAKAGLATKDLARNSRPKSPDKVPDIGAYEYYVPPVDIDIIAIHDPVIAQKGNNNISVVVKNNGSSAFNDTLFLSYRISSGTWVKDTHVVNSLSPGSTDTFTFSTKWQVSTDGSYNICAKIDPGISSDPDSASVDELCGVKCVGLQGNFTIDPSGKGDFRTFTDAVNSLQCGISGPIQFTVNAGTYNERFTISNVTGSSSTNTIIFKGVSKDRVILNYTGTNSAPANITLDGASNISFSNISIVNNSTSQGIGIWLKENSSNNTIDNCIILMDTVVSSSDLTGILSANAASGSSSLIAGNLSSNNVYSNNIIKGGSYGIRINGTSNTNTSDYNTIINNQVSKQYLDGISLGYVGRTIIRNNSIKNSRSIVSIGLKMMYCNRDTVDNNVIEGGRQGIYSYYENYSNQNSFSLIANNMVSNLIDPVYQTGILVYLAYNTNVYHNSVWIEGSYQNAYYSALSMYASNNCNVKNNILSSTNGAYVFANNYGTVNLGSVDYNNYYGTSTTGKYLWNGLIYTDLNTWKLINVGFNANSYEGEPGFISKTDLHARGAQVNNRGLNNLLNYDFDFEPRPLSPDKKVDIGADEFYVSPYDIDLLSFDAPVVPKIGSNPVSITLLNSGTKSLANDTVIVSFLVDGVTKMRDTIIINSLSPSAKFKYTFKKNWDVSIAKSSNICVQIDTVYKPDPDFATVDDICRNVCPGLGGNYTIDIFGSGDFNNFREAINALSCGINSPVVFTVKNGRYRERLVIPEIKGASATNTISFIGETTQRNRVIIEYGGAVDSMEAVHLVGADYIHFENMTINATSRINNYGIRLSNQADYNSFKNIRVNGSTSFAGASTAAVYISDAGLSTINNSGNYNSFDDCTFYGAFYGCKIEGAGTTSPIYGNSFNNCEFNHNRYYSLHAMYSGKMKINKCSFDSLDVDYMHIYTYAGTENQITNCRINGGRIGVYLYLENYYFQSATSLFANNFIYNQKSTTDIFPFDAYYGYNIKFYHNSLFASNINNGTLVRFRYGSGHDMRNNSLAKTSNIELFQNLSAAFINIDNNNYYAASSSNFVSYNSVNYNSLSDWQNGVNGFNKNSKEGDPKYTSSTDLTPIANSTQLANWGSTTTGITTDYEGDIRNPFGPDIGADEYSDLYDLTVTKVLSDTSSCNFSSQEELRIQIKNVGSLDIPKGQMIPYLYSINGGKAVLDTIVLASDFNKNDTLNLTFDQKVDFSSHTSYAVQFYTNISNDNNRNNDTLSQTIHSYETPKANFTYLNTCTDDETSFTSTSSVSTSTFANYDWDFGNSKKSTAANPNNIYSTTGKYNVLLKVTTSQGCSDTIQKAIDIYKKPTASFTIANSCLGDSTDFSNTSSIVSSSNANFYWNFGDGNTSLKINPKHKYAFAGSYNAVLIAESDDNCSDTALVKVNISPIPKAEFTAKDVCDGSQVEFSNSSNIPSGYTASYDWDMGDGTTNNNTDPKYTYGTIGKYIVELTASLSNGCKDIYSDTIAVNSIPVANFSAANTCLYDSVNFTNYTTVRLDSIKSYSWNFGDTKTANTIHAKHLYSAAGNYNCQLIATSYGGCSDTFNQTISIHHVPNATYSATTECYGDSTKFTNLSSISSGSIKSSLWQFGDGFSSSTTNAARLYASNGSYNSSLIIESDSGCSDTAFNNITVNSQPIAAFDVSNVCLGDKLIPKNNSSINSGSISSFNWFFGDGSTSTLKSPEYTYSKKDTYTVSLKVTSNNGCIDSLSKTVIVNNVLSPGFNHNANCAIDSVTFTNTTSTSCGTITNYEWLFGDGKSSNSTHPKHFYTNPGTYTVKLIVTQQGGFKDTSTQKITIYPMPTSNFSVNNVCTGVDANFTNSSNISSGSIASYIWNFGDGNSSSLKNPKNSYSKDGTYDVQLISISSAGCADTIKKSTTVYEQPKVGFTATDVCMGTSVKFNNSSSITSGTLTYNWQFGDGFSSSQNSPSYNYASAKNYNVQLTATSNNNCKATTSKTITVSPNPIVDFSAIDTCNNVATPFTNKSTISSGTLSYNWEFGDVTNSSAINPTHNYASPGSYSVKLTATSNKGCTDNVSKQVRSFASPTANFTIPTSCSGTNLTFNNTSSIASGTLSNLWRFGDGKTSTQSSPQHNYATTGNYYVHLNTTSNNGCIDSITKLVKVYDIPTASFSTKGNCINDYVTFNNTSNIASGSLSYYWDFGNGNSSTSANPKILYSKTGSYSVKLVVTSNWGCKDSSTTTVNIHDAPIADFSTNNVCLGNDVQLNNSSSIKTGTLSYLWDFENGTSSSAKDPKVNYTNAKDYNIKLIATSNQGCVDSLTKKVSVYPNPTADFISNKGCFGDTTFFTNTSISQGTAFTSKWDFGNNLSSNDLNPKILYSQVNAYQVSLSISNGNGCKDSIQKTIYINAQPNISYSLTNNCLNETSIFNNSSSISNGTASYKWRFGDNSVSNNYSATHLYIKEGTYRVSLTALSDSGCVDSLIKNISIYPKPSAQFSANNACTDVTINFNNTSSISTGGITSNNWSYGNGFNSTSKNPAYSYNSNGIYSVELISTSDKGCSDTAKQNITIYAKPSIAFTTTNLCFGDTFKAINSSTISSGSISSYNWNFGDGNSSSSKNAINYYKNRGNYTITLQGTSDKGCIDSLKKSITVDNKIIADFSANTVCIGEATNFVNKTNTSCGTISSYSWEFGDGSSSSKANPSYTYKNSGSYTVKLIVVQAGGNRDTATQTVIVGENPKVDFSMGQYCAKDTALFTNKSSVNTGSIKSFIWSFGDGNKSNAKDAKNYYATSSSYAVKLIAESNYGCKDSTSQIATVNVLPNTDFVSSSVCLNDSLSLSNKSTIPSGTLSSSWSFGDGNSSSLNNPKHLYTSAGTYTVQLTNTSNKGCVSSQSQTIYVNQLPNASFTVKDDCQNTDISFSNNSSISTSESLYSTWLFGDGFSSNSTNTKHLYSKSGSYPITLSVVSDSGCVDTAMATLRVFDVPNMSFTASNVCFGDTVYPVDNSKINSGTISQYQWNFGDGNSSTAIKAKNYYTKNGTYSIKLIGTSDKGCIDSIEQTVEVSNTVIAGFKADDVCLGDSAFFTNLTNTSCGTIKSFDWDFGDGNTASTANTTHYYNKAGKYNVRLIVEQNGGTKDTIIKQISVNPKPTVNYSVSSVCADQNANFQNLSTIGSGSISSYIWNFGNGSKSNSKNISYKYPQFGQYTTSLTAVSDLGCIDSVSKTLVIYEVPVSNFTANDVCFGNTVNFKNTSQYSSGTATYLWSFGDGFSSTQSSPNYNYSSANKFSVKLTTTSPNGCKDEYNTTVNVYSAPNVSFTIADTCQDANVRIVNNTTVNNGTASYLWTIGNSTSLLKNPSISFNTDGILRAKLVATSNQGCKDSVEKILEIFENPNALFTYQSTCPDAVVNFTNNSTGGNIYEWDFENTDTSMYKNPSYNFNNSNAKVTLKVINSNGCMDTMSRQINFGSLPNIKIEMPSICERDSLDFINKSTIDNGTATYVWKFGDGTVVNSFNAKKYYPSNALIDVTLIGTSNLGCKDSLSILNNTAKKPYANFSVEAGCLADSVEFKNSSIDSSGNSITFNWNTGDLFTTNKQNFKHKYASAGNYPVSLVVDNGVCKDSISQIANVSLGPVNLDFDFENACARSVIKFENKTTNPNLNYKWQFFDGTYSTAKNPTKFYPIAGTYTIGFEAFEGNCADSTYKVITILPYADSSFSYTIITEREVQFSNPDSFYNDYEWNFGDGSTSFDQNPIHNYSKDGTYKVTLTVTTKDGCTNSSSQTITVTGTSITSSINERELSVYPNPFNQFINLNFSIIEQEHVNVEVYDNYGRKIATIVDTELATGNYQYLIDESIINIAGIYHIILRSNNQVITKRIVKLN